jgi:PBP1b-binding outer membrane lipoprotein LpoB
MKTKLTIILLLAILITGCQKETNQSASGSREEPDIDNLMKIIEESISAYKACKSLVDAVQ